MATLELLRPRPVGSATSVKREVNDYLRRAADLERQHQFDEASVLYKRVVSTIASHEGTSGVDNELAGIKRDANQRLMQSALQKTRSEEAHEDYQSMVRQLSTYVPESARDHSAAEMHEQVFEDPAAFEQVHEKGGHEDTNAAVLFQLETGAKLFYIARDGSIRTTSETLPLTIYQVTEKGETSGLLKLGTWIYPLHPRVSPAFKTGYDAYIFPNNTSVGEFVGLMFDESVQPDTRYYFENVLSHYSVFMAQPGTPTYGDALTGGVAGSAVRSAGGQASNAAPLDKNSDAYKASILGSDVAFQQHAVPYDTSKKTGKLAAALITGTKFLTQQLATGVVKAENAIGHVSKNVQDKMVPNAEPVKVNRGLHATARGLRSTSEVTVKASGFVVSKIGALTLGLARTFAPNFGKVETRTTPGGELETVKLSGLRGIGHAGVTSFAIAYESCENAAKHLAANLANESIGVIKYKYGEDASILTENAAYAIGNTALTAYNVSSITGPKGIAKKVAKQTAKETVKNAFK